MTISFLTRLFQVRREHQLYRCRDSRMNALASYSPPAGEFIRMFALQSVADPTARNPVLEPTRALSYMGELVTYSRA